MDGWYNVTLEDILKHGGNGLLCYYNGSPSKALQGVYPDHKWMVWRFGKVPKDYWDHLQGDHFEKKRMLDWLGEQLSITKMDDWYRVSLEQIRKVVPLSRLNNNSSVSNMLRSVYPEHKWDMEKLSKYLVASKSTQRVVYNAMRELFPTAG